MTSGGPARKDTMKCERYEIGGKMYVQKALVLGQVKQLREVIGSVSIPSTGGIPEIVAALADRLPLALAVVLTPDGCSPRDKDLPALADEIEFAIEAEQVIKVVEDFFICNPVASLSAKLAGMAEKIRSLMPKNGSTSSASTSPTETLPAGTSSCGGTQRQSVSPTTSTAAER